uniref:FH2 domain-containing protein n=1 Tax=Paramoeba aestuarina TaxID=180227 RepID=A0A7S4L7S4_9EUKA
MAKGTMWEGYDDEALFQTLDLTKLESAFAETKPKLNEQSNKKEGNIVMKKQKISLLDGKRSQAISIVLSRFRNQKHETLRQAILEVDEEFLNLERVLALKSHCPDNEEIRLCVNYEGDENDLDTPEKFIRCIGAIPSLQSRLSSMFIKMSYKDRYDNILHDIKKVETGVSVVKNSQNLKEILKVLLAIGNYMNGGTARGGAFGFKLSSLKKLGDTKLVNNPKETLLHYLVEVCEEINPKLLAIPEELAILPVAMETEPDQIMLEIREVNASLDIIPSTIAQVEEGDNIKPYLQTFYSSAIVEVKQASQKIEQLNHEFSDLKQVYGANTMNFVEFMECLNVFILGLSKAMGERERKKERERRKVGGKK